ncbi:MAG: hypothetical protein J7L39_01800 [Candidatus Aenigmarchaeota archaeon]|nr:hypothetical protein [Candidatus Aenigmarchaeota archaeon]
MEKKIQNKSVYQTKDLYLAALLYAKKQRFLGLAEGENSYFLFTFEDKTTCQQLEEKYWTEEIEVNAKAFADAIRTLKDILFSKTNYLKNKGGKDGNGKNYFRRVE